MSDKKVENKGMTDTEKLILKLNSIETLLKQNVDNFRKETIDQVNNVWKDQTRQDGLIQDLLQQKVACLEEFDDRIMACNVDIEDKIDKKVEVVDKKVEVVDKKVGKVEKSWWKKAAIIYGVVIIIIGFIALQGMGIKDEVSAKVGRREFEEWRKIEFSHIVEELRDLRKDLTEELREIRKNQLDQLKENKQKTKKENTDASKRGQQNG